MSGSRHAGPGRHRGPPAGPAEAGVWSRLVCAVRLPLPSWRGLWGKLGTWTGMWLAAGLVTCFFGLHPRLAGS